MREKLVKLVHNTVDEVNQDMGLSDGSRVTRDAATVLYGSGATIDSMTLVALIVAVEENIRREFGLSVTFANEKAMSMERSPFRTLDSLIEYAVVLVDEAQNGGRP